jgi:group I intron endonuclease
VETCTKDRLRSRENWYLSLFSPLLNLLINTNQISRKSNVISALTRAKISASLKGRKDYETTRLKKSLAMTGVNNPSYGKGPGTKALNLAAELRGTKIYVYDAATFTLQNGKPFRSIRDTAKNMPLSPSTLPTKLDTNKPFKGYYYYSSPHGKNTS